MTFSINFLATLSTSWFLMGTVWTHFVKIIPNHQEIFTTNCWGWEGTHYINDYPLQRGTYIVLPHRRLRPHRGWLSTITYITLFTPVLYIFSDTIPQLYVPYFTKGLLYPEMSPSYTVV
jgi:hypothetical protein